MSGNMFSGMGLSISMGRITCPKFVAVSEGWTLYLVCSVGMSTPIMVFGVHEFLIDIPIVQTSYRVHHSDIVRNLEQVILPFDVDNPIPENRLLLISHVYCISLEMQFENVLGIHDFKVVYVGHALANLTTFSVSPIE
ncbi:hypothetical protein ACFX2I_020545 [Malus domestica]